MRRQELEDTLPYKFLLIISKRVRERRKVERFTN